MTNAPYQLCKSYINTFCSHFKKRTNDYRRYSKRVLEFYVEGKQKLYILLIPNKYGSDCDVCECFGYDGLGLRQNNA